MRGPKPMNPDYVRSEQFRVRLSPEELRDLVAWAGRRQLSTLARDLLLRAAGRGNGKMRAHQLVHRAVKTGKLAKPSLCEDCGIDTMHRCPSTRRTWNTILGHHTDYSRPLVVEWLCKDCHARRHFGPPRAGP